jgi:hypothetical protein
VIRSIPLGLLARKLLLLRQRYADVQWDVLTTESSATAVRQTPLVGDVLTYDDGRLSLRGIGRTRLTELHDRNYDLVVVPYADDIGSGFAHVRRAGAAVGGRRLVALTLGDRERLLPGNTFRWHMTAKEKPRLSSTR